MPDRRTIEPCSIVPAQALRTFGRLDYGRSEEGLLACDIRITMADGGVAMLTVRLDAQPVTAAEIRLHDLVAEPQRDGITRIRPRYENTRDIEQCVHQLQLADGTAVAVEAGAPSNLATDDFCIIGKAGLAAALTTVLHGSFTRHGFRAGTLASTPDFCGLVPADAPGLVPPLAAAKLEARAGGIDCIWKGTEGTVLSDRRCRVRATVHCGRSDNQSVIQHRSPVANDASTATSDAGISGRRQHGHTDY